MSESSTTGRGASTCGREHFPLAAPMLDDPRPFYARARREEPVFWSESLGLWVVTRYEDVCAVAKDVVRFSSRDAITPGAVPPPPELVAELVKGFPVKIGIRPVGHVRGSECAYSDIFPVAVLPYLRAERRKITALSTNNSA